MKHKFFGKIFFLILLLAFVVRFFRLGEIPVSLYWDEAAMLVDAKVVATTGQDMHGNPWYQLMYPSYGDYKLPLYIWLASLSVKFFGTNAWALRLPSALAGVGTVLVAGLLAHSLFKNSKATSPRSIQLTAMLVVAITPWSIMFSRTAFEGHLAQFLVGLSILILLWAGESSFYNYQAKKSKQNTLKINKEVIFATLRFSLSALMGALATYTYFSVRFVWPIVFIGFQVWFFLKFFWGKWGRTKTKLTSLITASALTTIIPLAIFFVTLLPMTRSPLYETSNQFRLSTTSVLNGFDYPVIANTYRQIAGNSFLDRVLFHRHFLLIKELLKNYSDHVNLNYLFVSGDSNLRHGTGKHGLFLLAFLPIFLYGIYRLFLYNKRALLVLFIWWMVALLPASVPETTPHALRSLNALIPLSIIIGVGLLHFTKIALPRSYSQLTLKKLLQPITLTFLVFSGFLIINFISFTNHYFNHYPQQSAYDWQDSYSQLSEIILAEKSSVRTVWVAPFENRFYLWLLADERFTTEQIQALPKENYTMMEVENIVFKSFNWGKLDTLDHKLIIVGEPNNIMSQINKQTLKPNWIREIKSHDGVIRFLVVHYGK